MPNHTLSGGVGPRERNTIEDVARTQAMLKLIKKPGAGRPYYEGRIDGQCGSKTEDAIQAFQQDEAAKRPAANNNAASTGTIKAHQDSARALEKACALAIGHADAANLRVLTPKRGGPPLVIVGASQSDVNTAVQSAQNIFPTVSAQTKQAIKQSIEAVHKQTGLAATVQSRGGPTNIHPALVGFKYVGSQGLTKSAGVKATNVISITPQESTLVRDSAYGAWMLFDDYILQTNAAFKAAESAALTGQAQPNFLAKAELNIQGRIKDWEARNWTEAAKALQHFAAGSGTPLQFDSKGLLKNKRFKQAVDTLKDQWANEIQGVKNNTDSKLSTHEGLFNAALHRQSGQRTPKRTIISSTHLGRMKHYAWALP